MVKFIAPIQKFGKNGEKTGWTYILVSGKIAHKIIPNRKTSFRVKGQLDDYVFEKLALIPLGGGDFVLPINATMRKAIRKRKNDRLTIILEADSDIEISPDLLCCLEDDPKAKSYFYKLPPSHQRYYSRWIESAKTEATRTKRITLSLEAFSKNLSYSEMMRMNRENK